ncbi:MAG: T9SS type A sorting domain-containing protein [Chitinophagales bacterium]|nr:T9SS type A sorting domain-containing protein [Chitinophagales bacterium]
MKQRVLLLLFAIIFGSISLSSYRDGYAFNGSDGSGATSAAGCSCHNTTNSLNTTVELDSAGVPVTSYVPGGSYTVKITATNSSATSWPKYGFQLASVKVTGSGTGSAQQAGTWSSTLPASVHQINLSIPIIEHSTPINATSGTGGSGTTYTQTIPWTAPASGTGSIKLYGIINAVNGNNGSNGDGYKAATAKTITEVVAPVTAGVSIAVTQGSNTICAGSSVTFTATPTNGGTTPTYQWKVDGANAGTGATFTSTTLTNGQVVTCVMTSNLPGVLGNPATSNAITMTVKAKSSSTVNATICQGQSYFFNGGNRTTAGTYLDTLLNAVGCDSLITLQLSVTPKTFGSISASICQGQSYFFNGLNLTSPGTYLDTLLNAANCDSILTLNLSVKAKSLTTINQGICQGQSFSFNGSALTSTGTYFDTLQNSAGCDSIITLNLTVNQKTFGTINKSICQGSSFFFNGNNLTAAGTYLDTLTNSNNCDSVLTLNLSLANYTSGTASVSICQGQSYFFNGANLTTAGTYKDTFTVSGACDSILTLTLSVKQPTAASISNSICAGQSFLFNGNNITVAGTYKDTLLNSVGCDSILTLTLSVKQPTAASINKTICAGQSYFFNGGNLTVAGTYKDTLLNSAGCDSVLTLNLTVSPLKAGTLSASICQGESYAFNGANLTSAGTYKDTLTVSGACDSIVTLTLTVKPLPTVSITQTNANTVTATAGFTSYEWYLNGTLLTTTTSGVLTVTSNGTYTVKVASNGCSATSAPLNVQIGGINDIHVGQLNLYPNPANQQLTIEVANWNQLQEGTLVNIYDVLGKVLMSEKLLDEKTTLNIERLQKGIYFARVNDSFVRFVKE